MSLVVTDAKDLSAFVEELRALDIKLRLDGDRLRVNAPTGRLTHEVREEIALRKDDIIAMLRGEDEIHVRLDPPSNLLSFAQERLWFLDQLEGGTAKYNVVKAVRMRGMLDLDALRQSLDALVERHAALRTTIVSVEGAPSLRVTSKLPMLLTVVDVGHVAADQREATWTQVASHEVERPFKLDKGPLFRVVLIQLSATEHVLILSVHHIVCDGWSMEILTGDLATIYQAYAQGLRPSLPSLPIEYADYAVWQRARMSGPELDSLLSYWRPQLAGVPMYLELPLDRARPAMPSGRGARVPVRLTPLLVTALKELGRAHQATPFMVLLAAFGALLGRYTGQEDLLIGSPIAGRIRPDLEGLVGLFVNTIALRVDTTNGPTFGQLLARVREVALGAYTHQELPFEKLVDALQPDRALNQGPVVQVMLALHNTPRAAGPAQASQALIEDLTIETGTAKFDLSLDLTEVGSGLVGAFEYDAELFDPDTVERLAEHFRILLEGAIADPDRPIAELPMLSDVERKQLLTDWNATQEEYPRAACVHQLIEACVDRAPQAIAVVCEREALTYGELDQRANRLAHHLRGLGVKPGVIVGLGMGRTLEMVVALLGIGKAGGTYLPLDPTYPLERRAFMLMDSGAQVLIADAHGAAGLPSESMRVVRLDEPDDQAAVAACPDTRMEPSASADDLAYVIYTSGSTGIPKGVMVGQRALVNFLTTMRNRPGLCASDVLLSVTTLSFDIAGLELFLPLTTGARVELVSSAVAANGPLLLAALHASGATIMQATPATWQLLLAAGWGATPGLRVLCGGEVLPSELAARLLERAGAVWNLYGPTETTIWSVIHQVTSLGNGQIPIGRPIANTQAYVLDARQKPVAIGVRGELYLGGDGVAHGYLNRPELTAARFVRDPFSAHASARLYRTGDMVRYRPDGTLHYIERADTQVKVRGQRIELGEIETLLEQQPTVQQAVVVVREDAPGDKRLAGYVVAEAGASVLPTELRAALRKRLPAYMVPTTLTILDALPLTSNGKVNRQGLPLPGAGPAAGGSSYTAPRDDVERALVRVWEDLLGHAPVGIHDNFFDIGGHSLLAAQLVFRIHARLGRNLPVATLLRAATVEKLADVLRAADDAGIWDPLVELQRGTPGRQPVFLVHGAFGDVLCYAELANALGPDQPCYVLQAIGLDGIQAPQERVEEMAAEYIRQMRTVQPVGPYCLAGYSVGGTIVYEMACQLNAAGEEIRLLAVFDHALAMGAFLAPVAYPVFLARVVRSLLMNVPHWTLMAARGRGQWRAHLRERLRLTQRAVSRLAARRAPSVDEVLQELEHMHGLEYLAEWPDYRRRVLEFQFRAMRTYQFRTYPGTLLLFRARRQPLVSSHDGLLGWGGAIQGGIEVIDVPGNHNSMLHQPYVQVLATRLRASLDAVSGD